MYDRVIIPTDGSKFAEVGVKEGLKAAKAFDIPAVSIYVADFTEYEDHRDEELRSSVKEGMKKNGEGAVRSVRKMAHDMGVEIETKLLLGKPFERITDTAEEDDIIYISSHGASGFSEFFFGSTAERVIKRANCTVAVVKGDSS